MCDFTQPQDAGGSCNRTGLAGLLAALRNATTDLEVERILDGHPETIAELGATALFDAGEYRRTELVREDGLLVVLIGWLPGQSSRPHDHGGSSCAYRILRGIAEERRYEPLASGEVREDTTELFLAGSTVRCDGEDIHSLGNPDGSDGPLVTLHVYRPAPDMRFFAVAKRGGR